MILFKGAPFVSISRQNRAGSGKGASFRIYVQTEQKRIWRATNAYSHKDLKISKQEDWWIYRISNPATAEFFYSVKKLSSWKDVETRDKYALNSPSTRTIQASAGMCPDSISTGSLYYSYHS